MNLAPLTPVVVALVLLILNALFKGDRHLVVDGNPTYTYPKGGAYFFLVLAAFIALLPSIIRDPHVVIGIPILVASAAIFSFIWAIRYRVVLEKEVISCGAFFIRRFRYSDITRVKYYDTQFMIYASSSRWPMTVFFQIVDFGSFLKDIEARLPKHIKVERLGRLTR
jgi:hypothetical protein